MPLWRRQTGLTFPLPRQVWEGQAINDATAYGVIIRHAEVPPGQTYWRVVRVHHLTPEENQGRHHILVEVLDEKGQRVPGIQVRVCTEEQERTLRTRVDERYPAVEIAMDKWSVYDVEIANAISDRVVGLSAAHPDEGKGNPAFHHSFLVVWQRAIAPKAPSPEPALESRERATAGEMLPQHAVTDETTVEQPAIEEKATALPEERVQAEPPLVAEKEAKPKMEAGPTPVEEPGPSIVEEEETPLDQEDKEVTSPVVTPTAPEILEDRPLDTFVLFLNAAEMATLGAFFTLLDELMDARVPFGFDTLDVARAARKVIVVGEVDETTRQRLASGPEVVYYIKGNGEELHRQWQEAFSEG